MISDRYKIIHVINHAPAYEEYSNKKRPAVYWDTSKGSWVGIWGYDWSNLLAIECLKISNQFDHEVWQPDPRAEKIYSHSYDNGLIHRLFPSFRIGRDQYSSQDIVDFIKKNHKSDNRMIFILSFPHFLGINREIIDVGKSFRFLVTFHGEILLPINFFFKFQKNILKKYFYAKQHYTAKRYFGQIDYVTYMNDNNLNVLKKHYYKGPLQKLTMGIDTNQYKPLDRLECRRNLSLPPEKIILLTVGRLNSLKQVDKTIQVLKKIHHDFLYLIIGHGTRDYENYLNNLSKDLIKKDKVKFIGFVDEALLPCYFNAANLFIQTSRSEGSSIAVTEAMACGLPIFCTDVGGTAELLKSYNKGLIVGIKKYNDWRLKLNKYFSGKNIESLDVAIVRNHYNWTNVGHKFIDIFRTIINE